MNKFVDGNLTVIIQDLKKLGREGGASAYLDNGDMMVLKAKYGTIRKRAFIGGKATVVDLKVDYKNILPKIKLINRNGILVAKRFRLGSSNLLKLTSSGYNRLSRKERKNRTIQKVSTPRRINVTSKNKF